MYKLLMNIWKGNIYIESTGITYKMYSETLGIKLNMNVQENIGIGIP